jgi:PHD/YefM family antitoxin component YafN of YafNO toxin-antitoxin module
VSATYLTSREFNRDPSRAKRAAKSGPVFVTERRLPALVVMTMADYEKLAGQQKSLAEVLMPDDDLSFEVSFPRSERNPTPADLD